MLNLKKYAFTRPDFRLKFVKFITIFDLATFIEYLRKNYKILRTVWEKFEKSFRKCFNFVEKFWRKF